MDLNTGGHTNLYLIMLSIGSNILSAYSCPSLAVVASVVAIIASCMAIINYCGLFYDRYIKKNK